MLGQKLRKRERQYRFDLLPYGRLYLAEGPKAGFCYSIGGDAAEGRQITDRESDYSAGVILRRGVTPEMLFEMNLSPDSQEYVGDWRRRAIIGLWHGRVNAAEFAGILAHLGWWFNTAWLNVENNAVGSGVISTLTDVYHYPHLLPEYSFSGGRIEMTGNIGFRTGGGRNSSKHTLIQRFNVAICGGVDVDTHEERVAELDVFISQVLDECFTFINNNGVLEGEKGKKDDCVIAAALAEFCHQQAPMSRPGNLVVARRRKEVHYRPEIRLAGY